MKRRIVYSSEVYQLSVKDVSFLDNAKQYKDSDKVVILLGDESKGIKDTLLSGRDILEKSKDKYIAVSIAYYTIGRFLSILVNFVKPLKRKYYTIGSNYYHTSLQSLGKLSLTRGTRNEENAYAWSNEKWALSEEQREERYNSLYNSLKDKGYLDSCPILILLNRNFGVKDQILQGHHRMHLCEEVGIDDVTIRFWSAPKAGYVFMGLEKLVRTVKGFFI